MELQEKKGDEDEKTEDMFDSNVPNVSLLQTG